MVVVVVVVVAVAVIVVVAAVVVVAVAAVVVVAVAAVAVVLVAVLVAVPGSTNHGPSAARAMRSSPCGVEAIRSRAPPLHMLAQGCPRLALSPPVPVGVREGEPSRSVERWRRRAGA